MFDTSCNIYKVHENKTTKIPLTCGIYFFYDKTGKIIYIGKSIQLRKRIQSHLRVKRTEHKSWRGSLRNTIHGISCIEIRDELLALIFEDKFIKMFCPYFNIRQKNNSGNIYLEITKNLFPTVKFIYANSKIRNKQIFGPLISQYQQNRLIDIIQNYFQVRICSDASPVSKCVYYDIGLCAGPCTGNILPLVYTKNLNRLHSFLNGENKDILEKMLYNLSMNFISLKLVGLH